jgi:hypothetical protein
MTTTNLPTLEIYRRMEDVADSTSKIQYKSERLAPKSLHKLHAEYLQENFLSLPLTAIIYG